MEKLYMNDLAYVGDLGEQSEKYHKEYYDHFGPISGSFSCNISKEQLNQIFQPMTEMSLCYGRIQKRTHKKRRINKKYAKKYGYIKLMLKGDYFMERGSEGFVSKLKNVRMYLEEE